MRPIDPQKQQLEEEIKKTVQSGTPIDPELMEYAESIFPSLRTASPLPENYNELAIQDANEGNYIPESVKPEQIQESKQPSDDMDQIRTTAIQRLKNKNYLSSSGIPTPDLLKKEMDKIAQEQNKPQESSEPSADIDMEEVRATAIQRLKNKNYLSSSGIPIPNLLKKEMDQIIQEKNKTASTEKIPESQPDFSNKAFDIFPNLKDIVGTPRDNYVEMPEPSKGMTPAPKTAEKTVPKTAPKKIEKSKIDVPPIEEPTAPQREPAVSEPSIEDLMKQVEEREKKAELDLASAKFRDAIIGAGGTGFKSDLSSYERAIKNAKKPLEDYKLKNDLLVAKNEADQKKLKDDPNSYISKLMRKSLHDTGYMDMTGFEKVSYSQLEKMYPNLINSINTKIAMEYKKDENNIRRQELALAKIEKLQKEERENAVSHIDFSMRQLAKPFKEYEDGISQLESAKRIMEDVRTGKVTPGVADVTSLYAVIKGLDPNSAVKEGEIALSREAMDLWGKVWTGAKGSFSGGDLLDNATRKSIEQILKTIQKTREKSFARQKSALVEAGVGKGINRDVLEKSIYGDVKSASNKSLVEETVQFSKSYKPGSTITLKDGRKYVIQEDGITGVKK